MDLKTLLNYLTEAPLPDGFDEEVFQNVGRRSNFAKTLQYAKERLTRVGNGSARVAFEFKYEGRDTILKLARNRKGLAQNKEESQLFDDWFVLQTGMTIPMIDYDEVSADPVWLHVEKAEKMTRAKFEKFFEFDIDVMNVIMKAMRGYYPRIDSLRELTDKYQEIMEEGDNEHIDGLVDLVSNYTEIETADLTRLSNWGIYKGNPVIIDLGLSKTVYKDLYKHG